MKKRFKSFQGSWGESVKRNIKEPVYMGARTHTQDNEKKEERAGASSSVLMFASLI